MDNAAVKNSGAFYDLAQIKEIPIKDICRNFLGIDLVERSGKTWCKTHNEKTHSTQLHENQNTFHNFGTGKHGDNIELVAYVMNVDRKDAISLLADAYGIAPVNQRKGLTPNELTHFEYAKIGLYGDLATKNFVFDVDKMPYERICQISEKFAMPMNELRKKHPKTYEKVIKQKAYPYVRGLRNDYFLDLWSKYRTFCAVGNPSLFFRPDSIACFSDQIRALEQAERIYDRAIKGTSLKSLSVGIYDPVKDLEMISKGEVKPVMGPVSYGELLDASKLANCDVKNWTFDYGKYVQHMMLEATDMFYCARISAGRVVIGFLESDLEKFKPYFDKMRPERNNQTKEKNNSPARSYSRSSNNKVNEPER